MVLFKDWEKLEQNIQIKFNRELLLTNLSIFLDKENVKVINIKKFDKIIFKYCHIDYR